MQIDLTKSDDGTISLKITIPAKSVEKVRKSFEENAPVDEKTNEPQNLANDLTPEEKLKEQVLNHILSVSYPEAIKQKKITPLIKPEIFIGSYEDGKDLVYTAVTCEEPAVDLKNYKVQIARLKESKKTAQRDPKQPLLKMEDVISLLVDYVAITVPSILIEIETRRLLSQLLQEIKRLRLTLDQYLSSLNQTDESIRTETEKRAENELKFEFILRAIALQENIAVTQADIDKELALVKDEKQRSQLSKNPVVLSSLVKQQKTIDFLSKLSS